MNDAAPMLQSSRLAFFRRLAMYSWGSLLLSTVANIIMTLATGGRERTPTALGVGIVVDGFFALTGIFAGVTALAQIRKYGRKGLLVPSVIGTGIWLALLVGCIPVFIWFFQSSWHRVKLAPAVHSRSASTVDDEFLGYSFDLPSGYVNAPALRPMHHGFAFQREVAGEPLRLLIVEPRDTPVAHVRLTRDMLPAGTRSTIVPFTWRGVEIGASRTLEGTGDRQYLTFAVLIPLRARAIRLQVGGAVSAEAQLRVMTEQILASFDGQTNW